MVTDLATAWRPFEPGIDKPEPEEAGVVPCAACSDDLQTPHADGLWYDGDALKCEGCGAVNHISFDGEDDGVYVSFYDCKHGKRDDEACDECELEFGDGVGEVA